MPTDSKVRIPPEEIGESFLAGFINIVLENTDSNPLAALFAAQRLLHGGTIDETFARCELWRSGIGGGVVTLPDVLIWVTGLPQAWHRIGTLPGASNAAFLLTELPTRQESLAAAAQTN